MAEEINEQETAVTEEEFDAVAAINELKNNSVAKSEYNKVIAERDKYLKALIEGNQIEEKKPREGKSIDTLRKELFQQESTNLDFAKNALELRNAIIESNGIDVFVGSGHHLVPTDDDYASAQKVADALQHCIEIADNDPEIFTRELMRITNDVAPAVKINSKIRR